MLHLQDVGISVVFAISYVSGGVASAVYFSDYIGNDYLDDCDRDICNDEKRVRNSEAASVVSLADVILIQID